MLDTHARNKIEYLFSKTSDLFLKHNFKPIHITIVALVIGMFSSISFYFDMPFEITVGLLWISGYLDAVDGSMARKSGQVSKMGTLMDIVFDRMVEIGIILAVGLKYEKVLFSLLLLACSIIISMSIFLTTASLAKNEGKKSFYYQAGFMERTEGFIFFTLMFIFTNHIEIISYIFSALIVFTAVQRFFDAKKIFLGK